MVQLRETVNAGSQPAVAGQVDYVLPWDAFLDGEAERQRVPEAGRPAFLRALRLRVESYRSLQWPNIKSQIAQQTQWVIPDGLEPHWVAPDTAVLWQEQKVRQRQVVAGPEGPHIEAVEVSQGWQPTSPIPFNNAVQVGYWLDLGLRLRPPVNGVSMEVLRGMGVEPIPQKSQEIERRFWCRRHEKGPMGFVNWKAYIQHTIQYKEMPTETPPTEVLERARTFKFYCAVHDRGWNHKNLAARHVNTELRRPGRAVHPTVTDMEVK